MISVNDQNSRQRKCKEAMWRRWIGFNGDIHLNFELHAGVCRERTDKIIIIIILSQLLLHDVKMN